MDKPICWVIDEASAMIIATHKTYDEALKIKADYPNNKLIILKEIQ